MRPSGGVAAFLWLLVICGALPGSHGEVAWFVSWQHAGHVRALGPTARELRGRGWTVAVVVHEEARAYVADDLPVVSAGPLPWTWEEELEFRDLLWAAPSAPQPNGTAEEAHAASVKRAEASERYFLGSQRSLARGLADALDSEAVRPDLLVVDVSSPGAMDMAELRGIDFAVFSSWPVGATLQAIGDKAAFQYPWLPSELFVFTQSAHQQSLYDRTLRALVTTAMPWALEWAGFHTPRRQLRAELGLDPAGLELMEPPRLAARGAAGAARQLRPLVLITNHWALDRPRPLPPHVALVGPTENYTARAAGRPPLQEGLREWLARAGSVVYISLGTNVRPKEKQILAMLEGIRLLDDISFLWDTRAEMTPAMEEAGLPPNLRAEAWVDQLAVLASGRTRAFVSHCGLNSLHEAMHFGVPIVALPYVADQLVSARLVVEASVGQRLDPRTLAAEDFAEKVRAVVDGGGAEGAYREAALRVGRLASMAGGARLAADLLTTAHRHGTQHLQMMDHGPAARLWDVWLVVSLPVAAIIGCIFWYCVSSRAAPREKND